MAPLIGSADNPINRAVSTVLEAQKTMEEVREERNITGGPGPLAFFGPPSGSAAAGVLGSVGTTTRAVGVVGTDVVTGTGPTSAGVEATTGVETEEVARDVANEVPELASGGIEGIRDVAESASNVGDVGLGLPSWVTGNIGLLAFAALALFFLAPLLDLFTALAGGTE